MSPAPRLSFPFWIVTPHRGPACGGDGQAATFSSASRAMAYMEAQREGEWDVRLVSRTSKPEIADFFGRHVITEVCHDQNPDGTGGELIPVADLLKDWRL